MRMGAGLSDVTGSVGVSGDKSVGVHELTLITMKVIPDSRLA